MLVHHFELQQSNASINLKFQHPFHPPDNPRAFENFILLNTSILIKKTCLLCWKDFMVLVQISQPTQTRFKFPNSPGEKKNPFWPVLAQQETENLLYTNQPNDI